MRGSPPTADAIFLYAGQYRAALPQEQSRSVVACRRRLGPRQSCACERDSV